MATARILLYAINGIGLGHLTRLLSIARATRELARALGVEAELQFVTTSEGSDLVHDFPVYKIPSKTMVASTGGDRRAFVSAAKILISNVIAAVRPDILVLDTVPEGAFRELLFVRDFARRTVFVDRIRKAAAIDRKHQSHLALFDRILVPDEASYAADYPLSPRLRERRRFVGRVHGYRSENAWSRERVRAYFAVPETSRIVYISAGGGGDRAACSELNAVIGALRTEPERHLLVGYGPLYRGPKVYGQGVTPVVEPEIWRFFPGVDVAVSAAGYNTYEELLAAGVPSVFYAQDKGLDAQQHRVQQGSEAGWHRFVPRLEAELLKREVERLEDPGQQLAMRHKLQSRGEQRGALRAATELLALHAGLEGSPVARRQLLWCAAARAAWRPCSDVSFSDAHRLMSAWYRTTLNRSAWDEYVDRAAGSWSEERADLWPRPQRLHHWMAWGTKLARWQGRLGWPDDRFKRLLQGAARDAQGAGEARERMLEELLESATEGQSEELNHKLAELVDATPLSSMASALEQCVEGLTPSHEPNEAFEEEAMVSVLSEAGPGTVSAG